MTAADLPELTFERLEVGRVYADNEVPVSAELIGAFCRAVDTEHSAYRRGQPADGPFQGVIAPPSLPQVLRS